MFSYFFKERVIIKERLITKTTSHRPLGSVYSLEPHLRAGQWLSGFLPFKLYLKRPCPFIHLQFVLRR